MLGALLLTLAMTGQTQTTEYNLIIRAEVVPKAKAARPLVEKMITLGKRGDLSARRQAASYLMTDEAVVKLFDTVGPRFGDRNGGYTRIIRTAWNKGDGADKAFLELLGSEKILDERKEKRAEARAKKAAEAKKAMEEAEAQAQAESAAAETPGKCSPC